MQYDQTRTTGQPSLGAYTQFPWRRLITAFVIYKLIVLFLAFVALALFWNSWPASLSHFCRLLMEWDSFHVLRTAQEGYTPKTTVPLSEIDDEALM